MIWDVCCFGGTPDNKEAFFGCTPALPPIQDRCRTPSSEEPLGFGAGNLKWIVKVKVVKGREFRAKN